jgi:hypothetical protein
MTMKNGFKPLGGAKALPNIIDLYLRKYNLCGNYESINENSPCNLYNEWIRKS